MNTLRERAQEWLDYYKASSGDVINLPDPETIAAVFAEYLHETKTDTRTVSHIEEIEHRVKELEFQIDGAERRIIRLEGENSALRFAIRCNGVSGAEVVE